MIPFTIIGNPENRRVTAFCEAVTRAGFPMPAVVPYTAWLPGNETPLLPAGSILRIESPGENDLVRRMFIARGQGRSVADIKTEDFGRIGNMRVWYAGYSDWLYEIGETIEAQQLTVMNHPDMIRLQFDKPRCQDWLEQHGVQVPYRLGCIHSYEHLRQQMREEGITRVFIKPAHASSASGVIAFREAGRHLQAVTSAEIVTQAGDTHLYNSLKVRTYTKEDDIAVLVDGIARENVFAEQWLPKAVLNDRSFDIRVLVIDGKARHIVIRTSNNYITNLHLGNQRGNPDDFIQTIGADKWDQVKQLAEQAAACFPASLYMGIDILLTSNLRHLYVLEVNAFGDLLPGLTSEGESCYEAQVSAMARRQQQPIVS